MPDNFQLGWRMTFEFEDGRSEPIVLGYPLTVEFNIHRSGKEDSQYSVFNLYNLSRATSQTLFKDCLSDNEKGKWVNVYFEAGYNNQYSLAYRGRMLECNTYRDGGSTEVITEVVCFDLNPLRYIGKTYEAGTPVKDIISDVATMLDLELGSIGDFQKVIRDKVTISGKGVRELNQITGGCTYVDNGKLHVLAPNECVDTVIPEFNSRKIYGTPRRSQGFITFTSKLSTEIELFQLVTVNSDIQPESNGTVKVFDIKHTGTISGRVPCSATTTLTCWYGSSPRNVAVNTTIGAVEENQEQEQAQTNTENKSDLTKQFVKVKGEKIVPAETKQNISLKAVYEDIKENGASAKSLNQRVMRNILWKQVIQPNNLSGSQRPTYNNILNLYNTLKLLFDFIDKNAEGRTIIPTSGWRSKDNNAREGGKDNSKHLIGGAIDFKFSNPQLTAKYGKIFEKSWTQGWAGYYSNRNFIHIQVNGSKPDPK